MRTDEKGILRQVRNPIKQSVHLTGKIPAGRPCFIDLAWWICYIDSDVWVFLIWASFRLVHGTLKASFLDVNATLPQFYICFCADWSGTYFSQQTVRIPWLASTRRSWTPRWSQLPLGFELSAQAIHLMWIRESEGSLIRIDLLNSQQWNKCCGVSSDWRGSLAGSLSDSHPAICNWTVFC